MIGFFLYCFFAATAVVVDVVVLKICLLKCNETKNMFLNF